MSGRKVGGEVKEHSGPRGPVYHHIGSGISEAKFFCRRCRGWYGVPHDGHDHDSTGFRASGHCACRPHQELAGTYGRDGVVVSHAEYRHVHDAVGERLTVEHFTAAGDGQ